MQVNVVRFEAETGVKKVAWISGLPVAVIKVEVIVAAVVISACGDGFRCEQLLLPNTRRKQWLLDDASEGECM